MDIVKVNSKIAAVKVSKDFNGTEAEVKKIAKAIGQYDNVESYRIDKGYVVFAFENSVKKAWSEDGSDRDQYSETDEMWRNELDNEISSEFDGSTNSVTEFFKGFDNVSRSDFQKPEVAQAVQKAIMSVTRNNNFFLDELLNNSILKNCYIGGNYSNKLIEAISNPDVTCQIYERALKIYGIIMFGSLGENPMFDGVDWSEISSELATYVKELYA